MSDVITAGKSKSFWNRFEKLIGNISLSFSERYVVFYVYFQFIFDNKFFIQTLIKIYMLFCTYRIFYRSINIFDSHYYPCQSMYMH